MSLYIWNPHINLKSTNLILYNTFNSSSQYQFINQVTVRIFYFISQNNKNGRRSPSIYEGGNQSSGNDLPQIIHLVQGWRGKNDQCWVPPSRVRARKEGTWTTHNLPKPGSVGQIFPQSSYEQNEKAYVWETWRQEWQLVAAHQRQLSASSTQGWPAKVQVAPHISLCTYEYRVLSACP